MSVNLFAVNLMWIPENSNSNFYALLIINEAYNIFQTIEKYYQYCLSIAPHWFDKKSYWDNDIEYNGPHLTKKINNKGIKLINENVFGPMYFIFLYALSNMVHDIIK